MHSDFPPRRRTPWPILWGLAPLVFGLHVAVAVGAAPGAAPIPNQRAAFEVQWLPAGPSPGPVRIATAALPQAKAPSARSGARTPTAARLLDEAAIPVDVPLAAQDEIPIPPDHPHSEAADKLPLIDATYSGAEVPVYPTRMPPAVTLSYRLKQGHWSGSGELHWQPRGDQYRAFLEGRVAGFKVMTWASEGALDPHGIAPLRFTDERRGRSKQAANFQRQQARITYSGPSVEFPLVPGAQDRLSWMIQIAAVVNADPQLLTPGSHIRFFVSGARGDADVWSFQVQGPDQVNTSSGKVSAIRLLRLPRKPHDTRVEVWLDPARHHLPARARLTSTPSNDTFELLLEQLHSSS